MTLQRKELVEELKKQKAEVYKLRGVLNELDKEKESWFKNRHECSAKIKESIQKIKNDKINRDSLTKEVKELKQNRDNINKKISLKLDESKNLKKEKIAIAKSLNIKEATSKIMQNIEKLEFKIETEPMSFDKEQDIMKKIKELRRLYDHSKIVEDINKKLKEDSESIIKMRDEANETHKILQEKAKQSQVSHEEILKLSAEIDKMKIEEESAFKKFFELKEKFNEVSTQLKGKLKAVNEIKEHIDKIDLEIKEIKKQEQEAFLRIKEEEINQKMKRGEKLTTEDLLVFQNR